MKKWFRSGLTIGDTVTQQMIERMNTFVFAWYCIIAVCFFFVGFIAGRY